MITGSLVALVTPMTPSGALDWESLKRLVSLHIEAGTDAIVAVGTTGESATLTVEEHCAVIEQVVAQVEGKLAVIAGTGANCTREAIHLSREAKASGANAVLSVTPYYNKPTQEGLYLHHRAIAEAVDIPQILYNVPGRTAVDMLPETVLRLAEVDNIVAIKEATGDLERAKYLIEHLPSEFAVYSGDDATAVELMLMGGKGNISVTANLVPRQMAELCRFAMNGQRAAAAEVNQPLIALHDALFCESNPIPVKWALQQMGLIQEGIRLPLTTLSNNKQPPLRAVLQQVALLPA